MAALLSLALRVMPALLAQVPRASGHFSKPTQAAEVRAGPRLQPLAAALGLPLMLRVPSAQVERVALVVLALEVADQEPQAQAAAQAEPVALAARAVLRGRMVATLVPLAQEAAQEVE